MKAIAAILLLALSAGPATAQSRLEGRFAAAALGDVEPATTLRIELLDDSDLNLRLVEDFEQALTNLGYRLADEAAYELTLETDEITDIATDDEAGITSIQIDTRSGANPRTGELGGTRTYTRLWSTAKDSLFARRRASQPGEPLLRMKVEIRNLEDRPQVVWVARAEALTRRSDSYRLFQQMVPVVAENIGQTVLEDTLVLR